jgi:CHASE2 domain-containing sensor protein
MTARRRKKRTDKRRQKILGDFWKGMLFALLMVLVKIAIEQTGPGHALEIAGYRFLQHRLSPTQVPIQVLDISSLAVDPQLDATPREPLQRIIDAVADQHPAAIGVDIDFSPPVQDFTYIHPDDEDFFQFCQNIVTRRKIPIYLGVNRRVALPKEIWFLSKDWQDLGAIIKIPEGDNRWMPAWIETKNALSMSAALATGFQKTHCKSAEQLRRLKLVEQISEKKGEALTVGEFLVDYSAIDLLKDHQTIRTVNEGTIRDQGHLFEDKIVLIGDSKKATDLFIPPDRSEVVPGVYFHASAAYTLIKRPLYHITGFGRFLIDLLETTSILMAILCIRLYFKSRTRKEVATHRLEGAFTILIVLAGIVVGVLLVKKTCVIWSDFILALAALLFHPSIERRMGSLLDKIKKSSPRFFNWLVFGKGKEGQS